MCNHSAHRLQLIPMRMEITIPHSPMIPQVRSYSASPELQASDKVGQRGVH